MTTFFWVAVSTTLLTFCFIKVYSFGFRTGARKVLDEWKATLLEEERDDVKEQLERERE